MGKKDKKFRPFKIPRYLKGSVAKETWKSDLREFNKHRYKIFTAQTKTDDKPPKLNPNKYVDKRRLAADAKRLNEIDRDNKELLKAINLINRTKGKVDTYNPVAYRNVSKWKAHEFEMKKIERDNKKIYKMLMEVKSDYSLAYMNKFWAQIINCLKSSCKFPLVILQKASADVALAKQPSISGNLDKIAERPLCFMEFAVQGGPCLGRVVIELYFDHVPVTVQNFLTICSNQTSLTYKNCIIHRIKPGEYCETGDITKGSGRGGVSIYGDSFAEEGHKLKHTKAGVLSMLRYGKHDNNSQFCITFANMEKLDKQNVVFGRIVQGVDNLFKIQGYGRKIGKPLVPVVISDCGKL